jgi:hypothetical protein
MRLLFCFPEAYSGSYEMKKETDDYDITAAELYHNDF